MEIIAEIGSNFETFEDCWNGALEAKSVGATAVKFQYFSHHDLYGFGDTETKFKREWLAALSKLAHKHSMKFGVTAFSQEGLDIVSPYVDFYKVASAENRMEFDFPRPLPKLVSTGGLLSIHEVAEVAEAHSLGNDDCIMVCVSAYPAAYSSYSLANFATIAKTIQGPRLGISDHTDTIQLIPEVLSLFRLSYIEKHFRPMSTKETSPDYPHSIGRSDFKTMVEICRGVEEGKLTFMVPECEKEFRKNHSRRYLEIDGVRKFVRPK